MPVERNDLRGTIYKFEKAKKSEMKYKERQHTKLGRFINRLAGSTQTANGRVTPRGVLVIETAEYTGNYDQLTRLGRLVPLDESPKNENPGPEFYGDEHSEIFMDNESGDLQEID